VLETERDALRRALAERDRLLASLIQPSPPDRRPGRP
jgi:hypothetical protein